MPIFFLISLRNPDPNLLSHPLVLFQYLKKSTGNPSRLSVFPHYTTDKRFRRMLLPGKPATTCSGLPRRWCRQHGLALRLVGCFCSVGLATAYIGVAFEANLVWIANGVLLAYLLLVPRRHLAAYACIGLLAQLAGCLLTHPQWRVAAFAMPLNLVEVFIGVLFLRRRTARLPRFTERSYLLRFTAISVLLAPLATGLVFALIAASWIHATLPSALFRWAAADGLGALVATPACVAIFRARFRNSKGLKKNTLYPLILVALSLVAFGQSKTPLAFLLYPILVLILLRLGLGWASAATLFVAAVGSWFTVRDNGPFASFHSISTLEPAIILQLFVASAIFILYSVSVVVENLRATERRLQAIAALHKLVTENSRDVIIIADFEGHRSFVSAAGAHWGEWIREDLLNVKSLDLVHPDDRPRLAETILELRAGKDGALVECRIRNRDSSYIWVEASLRTIRDSATGLPKGILNMVREITEHKLAEQQLADAYHTVEALAVTDALTGLANRRRFDQCLITEWRRAMRDRKPLSILLIDADLFKSYNDTYGHLRGDSCLKQIAEAAQDVVARPGDLVARFGGEEFAVILPNTGSSGALQLAHDICAVMRNRELPHCASPAGVVTVSVGCATLIPQLGQHAASLIDCADKALYQAKRTGRNRACSYKPDAETDNAGEGNASLVAVKSA
jgi:diguanylate cyclase (GGDEF)-like protein/PAS domain S-box-containing protein